MSPSAYRFCHEPGVDAEEAEPWCELVDVIPEERCPGLRATCEGADPVPASGCQEGSGGVGGAAEELADAPEAPPDNLLSDFDLEGVDAALRWIMALLVAVGVLVLGLADPAAALVGRRFGRTKLVNGRSLEGSTAFVVTAALAGLVLVRLYFPELGWGAALALAMGGAVPGALTELYSQRLDDNLTIPVAAGACAWLVASLF